MKRNFYIICTTFLGILLGIIVNGFVELPVIALLTFDIEKFGLGMTWEQWGVVHAIWTFITFIGGAIGGYFLGILWWRIVYVEHRHWRYHQGS